MKVVISQVEAKAHQRAIDEVKNCLYMYTHQWEGNDKKRVCENCKEVVEKWTICEASQLKANELVSNLLSTLSKLKDNNEHK